MTWHDMTWYMVRMTRHGMSRHTLQDMNEKIACQEILHRSCGAFIAACDRMVAQVPQAVWMAAQGDIKKRFLNQNLFFQFDVLVAVAATCCIEKMLLLAKFHVPTWRQRPGDDAHRLCPTD